MPALCRRRGEAERGRKGEWERGARGAKAMRSAYTCLPASLIHSLSHSPTDLFSPLSFYYNRRVVNVEIVIIGNEVLLGLVQDTNSNYLCRVVRGMGGRVRHIAVVRDEIAAIADEIGAALERRTDLLFTCGGLGPTDDDLTLAAIAQTLNRPLEINTAARAFVERR